LLLSVALIAVTDTPLTMLVLVVLADIGSCICAEARGMHIIINEDIIHVAAAGAKVIPIENLVFCNIKSTESLCRI
jgi:hypothetical protein